MVLLIKFFEINSKRNFSKNFSQKFKKRKIQKIFFSKNFFANLNHSGKQTSGQIFSFLAQFKLKYLTNNPRIEIPTIPFWKYPRWYNGKIKSMPFWLCGVSCNFQSNLITGLHTEFHLHYKYFNGLQMSQMWKILNFAHLWISTMHAMCSYKKWC